MTTEERNQIVNDLQPTVRAVSRRFRKTLGEDEALSIGNYVLVTELEDILRTFDPTKAKLSTFVFAILRRHLRDAVDRDSTVVTIPRERHLQRRKLRRSTNQLEGQGKPVTLDALSTLAGLSPRQVERALAIQTPDKDLFEPVTDKNEPDPLLLIETIQNPASPSPEEVVGKHEGRSVLKQILRSTLAPRQTEIMELLYFGVHDEPLSEGEVAKKLNLAKSTVKVVRQRSLKKLRNVEGLQPLLQALVSPTRAYGKQHLTVTPLTIDDRPKHERGCLTTAKLTQDDVREIRRLFASGVRNKDLAKQFGVAPSQITAVTHRKTWRFVSDSEKKSA